MKQTAIQVKNLTKIYHIYERPSDVLKEIIFRKNWHQDFKALDNISFEVSKGEIVGIIGPNGSGKSTLLKIIAGTLDKTEGEVKIQGRISSILELSLGFHPEYTGRENIYNGGMILGMNQREINRKMDAIIDFSELGEFIDRPFKTYSAGMQARLTFSVATAIEPELLIIDEALAAGDAYFVAKCMERMTAMCQSGATVLFVSHGLPIVRRLCNRAIYLEKGRIIADGPANDVCQLYENQIMKEISQKLKIENIQTQEKQKKEKPGKSTATTLSNSQKTIKAGSPIDILKVQIFDHRGKEKYSFYQNDLLMVRLTYEAKKALHNLAVWIVFTRVDGVLATSYFSCIPYQDLGIFKGKGYLDVTWPQIYLGEGDFSIGCGIAPYFRNRPLGTLQIDSYVTYGKSSKINIKKKHWPLMTVYEQPVEVEHYRIEDKQKLLVKEIGP